MFINLFNKLISLFKWSHYMLAERIMQVIMDTEVLAGKRSKF